MKLIVGLGNPEPRYAGTRHNLGCLAVRLLARGLGLPSFRPGRLGLVSAGEDGEGQDLVLLLPTTYMNRSGAAVRAHLEGPPWSPEDLVVVHDDLDLAPGRVKVKLGGSSGGHLGVASVIEELGSEAFVRVRVGIGRPPPGVDPVEFVLGRPSGEEADLLVRAARRAADAVAVVLGEGLETAMNRFNRRPDRSGRAEVRDGSGGAAVREGGTGKAMTC
jgi:PTH1 family peptidyl-tRNA hydrolase